MIHNSHAAPNYDDPDVWGRESLIERIIQLEQELGARHTFHRSWPFTETELIILAALDKAVEGCCTKERLYTLLYSHLSDPPELKNVDVFICRIRKKLRTYGIEFTTIWGRGWWMDAENREKLSMFKTEPQRKAA